MDYYVPLLPDNIYHILSRATGNEQLFIEPENYRFFLRRYHKYISPVADTFAYSLLPNHFHFMVQIKPYEHLLKLYKQHKKAAEAVEGWQPVFVMQQFSNLLNSYTKSFNNTYDRKGSLFMDYLRRVEVKSDAQYSSTIFYIHKNPVHHGYCDNIKDWPWSSYNTILSKSPTKIQREKVLDWFGSVENFIDFHSQPIQLKNAVGVE